MTNGQEPATKQDIAQLKEELLQAIRESEARFREAIHDSETRLLTAFHGYAERTEKRLTEYERVDNSFRERFVTLEQRVLKIERRLDLPESS